MRQRKIHYAATVLIAAIIPFLLYYPYRGVNWLLNMAFLEPGRWHATRWAEDTAVIDTATRSFYFAMWFIPVLAGIYALVTAIYLLMLIRRGHIFHSKIATGIFHLGGSILVSALSANLAATLSPKVVSWHNAAGPLPLRFWYDSEQFGLVFCGIAFYMFGWFMREAIAIAKENEEFV